MFSPAVSSASASSRHLLTGSVCRMFNDAIARQSLPKHVSTDHDPLFRFHRWLANLRVLEIDEVKSVPYAPVSHPFVERLVGTIRREFLDCVLFWNSVDLTRKLGEFRDYYSARRVHRSLDGTPSAQRTAGSAAPPTALDHYVWQQHCRGLFQLPLAARARIRHQHAGTMQLWRSRFAMRIDRWMREPGRTSAYRFGCGLRREENLL